MICITCLPSLLGVVAACLVWYKLVGTKVSTWASAWPCSQCLCCCISWLQWRELQLD
jgi:hypothetical protein